jgi:hypothetical protein
MAESIRRFVNSNKNIGEERLHFPLDEWDNNYIRRLYSTVPTEVAQAISHLSKVECRAGFEHMYGLLHGIGPGSDLADRLFQQLIISADERRSSQMLVNLLRDRPLLRPAAVHAIGRRAQLSRRSTTDAELDATIGLATDTDDQLRYEVAHALGKIVIKRRDRREEIRKCLQTLQNDSVQNVRTEAAKALQNLV